MHFTCCAWAIYVFRIDKNLICCYADNETFFFFRVIVVEADNEAEIQVFWATLTQSKSFKRHNSGEQKSQFKSTWIKQEHLVLRASNRFMCLLTHSEKIFVLGAVFCFSTTISSARMFSLLSRVGIFMMFKVGEFSFTIFHLFLEVFLLPDSSLIVWTGALRSAP